MSHNNYVVRLQLDDVISGKCPWEIGSAWAARVGQGEAFGCTEGCRQHGHVWACLGLAMKIPLLEVGRPFLA